MKTVLQYPGSKWRIANWIISHFPGHHSYVEPFAGSLAVLFNKPLSNIETINDLDLNVVNFFQCIREDAERLAKLIEATPYSRREYDNAYAMGGGDRIADTKRRGSFLSSAGRGMGTGLINTRWAGKMTFKAGKRHTLCGIGMNCLREFFGQPKD